MTRNFNGFVGLNHQLPDFADYVMLPAEISEFLQSRYLAPYAYPRSVANAFGEQPAFYATTQTANGFQLHADLETNQIGSGCIGFFTKTIMPFQFCTTDAVHFIEDNHAGLGTGSLRVDTLSAINKENSKPLNCLANKLITVHDRNAVMLKVKDAENNTIPDVAIFFPDAAHEASHKKVRFGEAFVLIKEGVSHSNEMLQAVQYTFAKLVKQQYEAENGLWMTEEEHACLEVMLTKRGYVIA